MNNKEYFLSQSYQDAWNNFNDSLRDKRAQYQDWIVITASNERQAETYRIQIEKRVSNNSWPINSKWMVIPDLNGERSTIFDELLISVAGIPLITGQF